MYTGLTFIRELIPGISRYIIGNESNLFLTLPDVMTIRYYLHEDKFFESYDKFLPKLHDLLEYDVRTEEWYIIKKVL